MGEKKGFFSRLARGLSKTRENIVNGIDSIFKGFSSIDDDFYEELEEILIMGDIGIKTTSVIMDRLKQQVDAQKIKEPEACRNLLISIIKEIMKMPEDAYRFEEGPSVVLAVGVNGVGKTTSIGKLASRLKDDGKKVMLAAADTFRAAATEQLQEWAQRAGVDIVTAGTGADPAAVIYDAIASAKSKQADILLADTAGRLHNKKNLMQELAKINRIISTEYPEAKKEVLLVLDASLGQNSLVQAKEFSQVTHLTGIILTKLDGTSKGGIAVAIQSEMNIPVKYIGVGETVEDLEKFDPDDFVEALFDWSKA